MAAKLLMKRFAIKDVSESLVSFVIKYSNIVPLLRRWLLILSTCSLKIFSQVPSWMKNFDEDNDGRLNYREFKQVNLG